MFLSLLDYKAMSSSDNMKKSLYHFDVKCDDNKKMRTYEVNRPDP